MKSASRNTKVSMSNAGPFVLIHLPNSLGPPPPLESLGIKDLAGLSLASANDNST